MSSSEIKIAVFFVRVTHVWSKLPGFDELNAELKSLQPSAKGAAPSKWRVRITDEDEYFPPPRNLRDLQSAIETAITTMSGGSLAARPIVDDRALAASHVLASLQG